MILLFEQVLLSKFYENLSFSSSRLHPSSRSIIGSVEDRSVLMTIHDICFDCIGYVEQVLSSKFLENLLFSSSRLHPSSCSVIGSVEDRSVLMTIHYIYNNTVWCFEQVLSSKFPENLSFSSSRLHLSSCSIIGSVEDRSVLMTINETACLNPESVPPSVSGQWSLAGVTRAAWSLSFSAECACLHLRRAFVPRAVRGRQTLASAIPRARSSMIFVPASQLAQPSAREPFGLETVTRAVMPSLTFVVSASLSTALQPLLQQGGQQQREGQQQQRQEGQQQLQPPHALGDARMQSGQASATPAVTSSVTSVVPVFRNVQQNANRLSDTGNAIPHATNLLTSVAPAWRKPQ